ncbi:MAG TPA: hypothetical protein EYJ00_03585 [Gammaproteobacteria bacterium]|nr:hypothetical protein [Gammaproteobacteria bacterium]
MKKQLLIAAVAVSMTSVAMADISLSGKGNLKFASTGTSSVDVDLAIKGTFAAGSFKAALNNMQDGNATFANVSVSTTVEGVSLSAGTVKHQVGNGNLYKKSAFGLVASKTIGGITVMATTGTGGDKNAQMHLVGSVAGFDVKVENAGDAAARFVTIGGNVGGFSIDVENSTAAKSYAIGTTVGGATVTYVKVEGDANQNDGIFGDISSMGATDTASGIVIAASGVTFKSYAVKGGDRTNKATMKRNGVAYTVSKKGTADAVLSAKVAFTF